MEVATHAVQPSIVLSMLSITVADNSIHAADWLRFRGPNGSGISTDEQPTPVTWSPSENLRWKTALPGAGVSCPIVVGDVVVVPAGAESRAVIGFDKATGKELWRAESDGLGNVWGTPGIAVVDDDRLDVVIGAPYEIWGLNPANGKLRWYCDAMETDQFNSSVVIHEGVIYAVEGRGGGSIAIRGGGKGDVTKTNVVWSGRDSSRFGSPVILDGRLYYVGANRIMNCINAETGERIFQNRMQSSAASTDDRPAEGEGRRGPAGGGGRGSDYSSLVAADGKLYFAARNGDVFVVKASDQFEQLAVNRLTEDPEDFSATPAVSNGELFFRSNRHLYCVSDKK